jgi:hypothetical protein
MVGFAGRAGDHPSVQSFKARNTLSVAVGRFAYNEHISQEISKERVARTLQAARSNSPATAAQAIKIGSGTFQRRRTIRLARAIIEVATS